MQAWFFALWLIPTVCFAQPTPGRSTPNQPGAVQRAVEVRPQPFPGNNAEPLPPGLAQPLGFNVDQLTSPQGLTSSLKVMLLLTVLTLAPSILIMTTCFIRFVIVLSLLRQALGTQTLPPNQVIVSLCLFLTVMVMAPVWQEAYEQGVKPYTSPAAGAAPLDEATAFARAAQPLRRFMAEQIDRCDNSDAVWMFIDFQRPAPDSPASRTYVDPESYDDVSLTVLIPAYMLSELKAAFVIGFQIYLPFLVIDLVISALLISMGMMMLPPVLISLPLKLLLFVLIDGWFLTVGMLLESVRPMG
ncbi:MAG: flagellar type III secretion system pore protein FliP [Planctomycetaceae bacterium]|nr:flagellar type III secretion system pore protein FliP [Planctomycetaceae bacterium]